LGESIVRTVDRDYITDDEMDFDLVKSGQIFIPIGYKNLNTTRERVFNEARARGLTTLDHISSEARIHKDVVLAPNSSNWIQENVMIQTGCKIGRGNILWSSNTHIGHNSTVQDFCWLTSGCIICSSCTIESNVFIGANSVIAPQVVVGHHSIVSSLANLTKSVPPYSVVGAGHNNILKKDSREVIMK
jgi:acetyltransferase-like isoleucine patch superfamily enzyme